MYPKDRLEFTYIASAAPTSIFPSAIIEYDAFMGDPVVSDILQVNVPTIVTTRTPTSHQSSRITRPGTITRVSIDGDAGTLKRGQFYGALYLDPPQGPNTGLMADYFRPGHVLEPWKLVPSGPGGGEGNLEFSSLAGADVAGDVTTTLTLGAANAFRRIRGYSLFYNASADVATRTITATLRRHFGSLPTGFTAGANENEWVSPTVTLTASEEGHLYAYGHGAGFVSSNDNGTVTAAANDSAGAPFPIDVTESMSSAVIIFAAGAGNANDRYQVVVLFEEWLVV